MGRLCYGRIRILAGKLVPMLVMRKRLGSCAVKYTPGRAKARRARFEISEQHPDRMATMGLPCMD